jgi:nicotinamidase-related amidase
MRYIPPFIRAFPRNCFAYSGILDISCLSASVANALQVTDMFEIDENNLPVVRTRQAFLALDLQNDFVATGSILHVNDPPNFVENIVNVAAHFRNHGNVIWVQTVYKASRPVNLTYADSEKVITATALLPDNQIDESSERVRPRPSGRRLGRYNKVAEANGKEVEDIADLRVDEREMDEMSETYLTVEEGQMPQIVLPASPGTNICQAVANSIDGEKDLIFQKSHYSAFKDGSLVQILRAKFVTEIYICGVLTNISVFATAMDAARYGYAITILDDCLGYRSKTRHDLALKMLGDFAGCEIIASSDLIDNLQRNFVSNQTTSNIRSSRTDSSLENLLSSLSLKPASSSGRLNTATAVSTSESRPKSLVDPIEKAKSTTKLLEAEGKKRERVKTKIRTRKRHAEPVSKTSATLMAASQVFEDISTPDETQTSLNSAIETIKADQHELECPSLELAHVKELDESVSNASNPKSGPLCEGDTTVIWDLLNEDVSDGIFDRLRDEALWQKMSHQGGDVPRLVSVQGQVAEDGSIPVSGYIWPEISHLSSSYWFQHALIIVKHFHQSVIIVWKLLTLKFT